MKRNTRLPVLMAVLCVFVGCASAPETSAGLEESKLSLRDGAVLEGPACGLESPECPEGLTCASLDLDTGRSFQCVRAQEVCDRLQCGQGRECVILESYPAQIRCGPERCAPPGSRDAASSQTCR
ncbi:hypothetical protein [Pyxidicoccus trucidator]|uniref:hypothetical protein n=1 Tax=Pyxidicoccus trucidator TaxID=2709662 RepID=UPI0013DC0202|nr:hypothetical protein [Pyxidicoccus trucidator]